MFNLIKDEFDENSDDILESINEMIAKQREEKEKEEKEENQ